MVHGCGEYIIKYGVAVAHYVVKPEASITLCFILYRNKYKYK